MKKTITINISGVIFNIEEDAYEILRGYLDRLSRNFTDSEGREEIMGDIEARIAELFQERLGDRKEVVSDQDVQQVMVTMGKPEDFNAESEGTESQGHSSYSESASSNKRRIYRDTEKNVIGGVCAGISHYFGWDPLIVRLILLVLFLGMGFGFLVYIILWIIIPEAKTTSEKLEMRGEPVNVENIKKKVSETFKEFSEKAKVDGKFHYDHARKQAGRASDATFDILKRLVSFVGGVIGFFFLMLGLLLLTVMLCAWYDPTVLQFGNDAWNIQWADLNILLFDSPRQGKLFFAGTILMTLIPLLALILLGVKILFRPSLKGWPLVPALIALWLIGLGVTLVTGLSLGKEFNRQGEYLEYSRYAMDSSPLMIKMSEGYHTRSQDNRHWVGSFSAEFLELDEDQIIGHYPKVDIQVNEDSDECVIKVIKHAHGFTEGASMQRAENISYSFEFKEGNELTLDSYFSIPLRDKFRAQECDIEISIPVGSRIIISEEMQAFLEDVQQLDYHHRSEIVGREWIMSSDGLMSPDSIQIPEPPKEVEAEQL